MRLDSTYARLGIAAAIVAVVVLAWLRGPETTTRQAAPAAAVAVAPDVSAPAASLARRTTPAPARRGEAKPPSRDAEPRDEAERDHAYWRTADIEAWKRAIYALEIDSIEEIPRLDALVHVEAEDPRELWATDWAGVDDWKRYRDGFSLERGPDGTLLFHPGEETQRMFTFFESLSLFEYDEANQAFVNEVDYYGKPIFNVVKFLREDVLVLMTISGRKVDLNVFQQGDYR